MHIPEHDRELLKNAMKYCSKFTIANPANFKIVNFKKVAKAEDKDEEPLEEAEEQTEQEFSVEE